MNQCQKILYLQNKYRSAINIYLDDNADISSRKPASEPDHCGLIETRSIIFEPGKKSITISTLGDCEKGYGYHNLRIISDLDKIEFIEFTAGGSLIDKSYPSILKNYIPFSIFQEHALPALKYHCYEICVRCSFQTKILYDVVKLKSKCGVMDKLYKSLVEYDADEIDLAKTSHKFSMRGYPTIIYLKTFLPKTAKNVYLTINDDVDHQLIFYKQSDLIEEQNNYSCWELNFGRNGISLSTPFFTESTKAILSFETEPIESGSQTIHIFPHRLNILRFADEMCCPVYS